MSICVAALPRDDVDLLGAPDPHVTIVWAGQLVDADDGSIGELRTLVPFAARFHIPFEAMVVGTDTFGRGVEATPVLRLEAPQFYFLRNVFHRYNKSEYLDFKPHLSVTQPAVKYPQRIPIDRIALWLGDSRVEPAERITYVLGTGAVCGS